MKTAVIRPLLALACALSASAVLAAQTATGTQSAAAPAQSQAAPATAPIQNQNAPALPAANQNQSAPGQPAANGQNPQPSGDQDKQYTITVPVNEVYLEFAVTDKHGHFIRDLQQSQFALLDDRKAPAQVY